jgi:hypothetical protein
MCFSAEASFTAAAVLAIVGSVTVVTARGRLVPLAATPLLFAAQQAAEGVLWVASNQGRLDHPAADAALAVYLIFAFAVWPVWIPAVLGIAEPQRGKKRPFWLLTALGVGLLSLNVMTTSLSSIRVEISCCSIAYAGAIHPLTYLLYPVCTIAPFFLSSLPQARLFGLAAAGSAIVAATLFATTFASVWCFFAAWISVLVLRMVRAGSSSQH